MVVQNPPPSRWSLASLALATLLPSLGSSIANVALPTIAANTGSTFAEVQWVVLAYLVTMTSTLVFAGWAGDLLGHRRLLMLGLWLLTGASVLGLVTPSLPVLVSARAIQGVGAAVLVVAALVLADELAPERRGRAMGLLGSMSALGTALGPSVGGVLVSAFSFRGVFLASAVLGLGVSWLAHSQLASSGPATRARRSARDHLEALIAPLREPELRARLSANAAVSALLMATLVVGPFHLMGTFGLTAASTGAAMTVGPVMAALLGMPSGLLVERHGPERTTGVGLLGICLGALVLALSPPSWGIPGFVLPVVLITSSYALFQAANGVGVMRLAGPAHRGGASGALSLSRNLGLIGGAAIFGALYASAGLRASFVLGAALIGLALAVFRSGVPVVRPLGSIP